MELGFTFERLVQKQHAYDRRRKRDGHDTNGGLKRRLNLLGRRVFAATKSKALEHKYEQKVEALLAEEDHSWMKGLSPGEAEALRKMYSERYGN